MAKTIFVIMMKLKCLLTAFALLALDLFIYIILGIGLMSYEDNYVPSKGTFDSWASMSALDKSLIICLNIWNILNVIALLYIGYIVSKRISQKKQFYGSN